MASILLPPDATLEAYAHCCTALQVQEILTRTPRRRLQTHGHIAVARSMEFNKDSLGVTGKLLEERDIQMNQPEFGGEEGNTLLHLVVLMQDEEKRKCSVLLLILKRPDVDPNVGNSKGDTPLHSASRDSSVLCVDILLDDPRVNVAAVNYNRQTCLHVTCNREASSTETCDQIDQIAGKIIEAAREKVRSFPQFLMKKDQFGNLAIHLAAKNRHYGVVKRMLVLIDDSHVDDVIIKITDQDGFGLLHHAVLSGGMEILALCIDHLSNRTRLNFDLYMKLLAVARDKNIADFLLQCLNNEIVKNSTRKVIDYRVDYLANLLHFAVSETRETLVELIVKWYPKQAVVAMHEALETVKETIQAVLRDHPEVQREFDQLHKAYTSYVTAANAILVVAVLIIALTFGHCMTSVEVARHRKDIIELEEYGGPPEIMKLHWIDFVILPRWAFVQAMVATILSAFAALPFSFAFFFHEAVDDTKVKGLLSTTKVLIVSASYCLVLSLEALFFSFVCSQFIAPYIDYKCARACEVALSVFFLFAMLFLGFNFVRYWRRPEGGQQGVSKFMDGMMKILITMRLVSDNV